MTMEVLDLEVRETDIMTYWEIDQIQTKTGRHQNRRSY